MSISWTDDLATGVAEIDEQHRELYRQVAALHEAMKARDFARVPRLLAYLRGYAVDHFATEERAMIAARYPGLEAHRRAHRRFVDAFERQAERATERVTPAVMIDLSSWLGDWLRDHVRQVDRDLARFLRALGTEDVPRARR